MKTHKKIRFAVLGIVLISCAVSCGPSNYKMVTKINKDGSCERIVYASADSAFLAGDTSKNPFLFALTPAWKIEQLDTALQQKFMNKGLDVNVKAMQVFKKIGDCSAYLQCEENLSPLVTPVERLKKRFRWFYTYYSFSARYKNIADKLPVPLSQYMTKEEQMLWFQGDLSGCKGMTGWELKNKLDEIEKKYNQFQTRVFYEEVWYAIDYVERNSSDTTYLARMNSAKDTLFSIYAKEDEKIDVDFEEVCKMLDNYLKTNHFCKLYEAKKEELEQVSKQKMGYIEIFMRRSFEYELIMPGKIISANTSASDTLSWDVEAFRFLGNDYILEAQSRTINIWAFVLTFFLGILTVFCFVKIVKMKKRYNG